MTRVLTLVFFFAFSITAFAQADKNTTPSSQSVTSNAPQLAKDENKDALIAVENQWVEALQKGDAAALDTVLYSTYVDTDDQGHRSNKRELLSVIKSGDLKCKSITLSDMDVHAYGSNTAVVTGDAKQDCAYKNQTLTAAIVFTDTFIKHNGTWKAVASHRSPSNTAAQGSARQIIRIPD
jgi:ketosteroid isomerase-like protein